ncbi:putative Transmembrane protein [Quillaja saponaria]|uniref:Transmembrane protein n=1 Tax=Quillaja saponaria TaxID=32244 RepID=A0AAD7P629_QUISA|nr:putative Transmembrane protein [Quillaja saponaria]
MSFQPLQQQPQQQQQQQPAVQVYPNPVTRQEPSHHSDGSFGAVFIVLAVIVVISAIACFLGRLCNKRSHSHTQKPSKQKNQTSRPKEGDVEFGLDKRFPTGKPAGVHVGGSRGFNSKPPESHGNRGFNFKPPESHGNREFDFKPPENHGSNRVFDFKPPENHGSNRVFDFKPPESNVHMKGFEMKHPGDHDEGEHRSGA